MFATSVFIQRLLVIFYAFRVWREGATAGSGIAGLPSWQMEIGFRWESAIPYYTSVHLRRNRRLFGRRLFAGFATGSQLHVNALIELISTSFISMIFFSAFAYSLNTKDDLHSEHGFLTAKGQAQIALSTVMNNGNPAILGQSFWLLRSSWEAVGVEKSLFIA